MARNPGSEVPRGPRSRARSWLRKEKCLPSPAGLFKRAEFWIRYLRKNFLWPGVPLLWTEGSLGKWGLGHSGFGWSEDQKFEFHSSLVANSGCHSLCYPCGAMSLSPVPLQHSANLPFNNSILSE